MSGDQPIAANHHTANTKTARSPLPSNLLTVNPGEELHLTAGRIDTP